jgi:hypothetical protein
VLDITSKPRTALFREKENDEPMAPQVNISGDISSTAMMSTKLIFHGVNLRKQYEKQFVQIGSMLCGIKSDYTSGATYFNPS